MSNRLLILGTTLALSSPVMAAESVGQVISVSGKVLLRMEASQGIQTQFLKSGDRLPRGAVVNTGSVGSAKILMSDRTVIDLGPSSIFKVNEYDLKNGADRNVDLSVEQGTARASVNQKVNPERGRFTIRTKAATMGVRGTEFVIQAGLPGESKPKTSVTVIEGRVEILPPSPQELPIRIDAGNQFVQNDSGSPSVMRVEPQKLSQIRSEAYQRDPTFIQMVAMSARAESDTPTQSQTESRVTVAKQSPEGARSPSGEQLDNSLALPPPPPPPSNMTLAGIVTDVTSTTSTIQPFNTPGFQPIGAPPPPIAPVQGVQIIQGLPRNLRVNFTP